MLDVSQFEIFIDLIALIAHNQDNCDDHDVCCAVDILS